MIPAGRSCLRQNNAGDVQRALGHPAIHHTIASQCSTPFQKAVVKNPTIMLTPIMRVTRRVFRRYCSATMLGVTRAGMAAFSTLPAGMGPFPVQGYHHSHYQPRDNPQLIEKGHGNLGNGCFHPLNSAAAPGKRAGGNRRATFQKRPPRARS